MRTLDAIRPAEGCVFVAGEDQAKQDAAGKFCYTLRDFPSLTGTFLRSELLGDREVVRIGDGAVVTIGATTFILHTPDGEELED